MGDLPSEFDLIVIGTGMVESMVSAAASRIGKRVLHVDSAHYYGGQWASFNLEGITNLTNLDKKVSNAELVECEGESLHALSNDVFVIKNVEEEWHVRNRLPETKEENDEAEETEQWTKEKLLHESRKFNIDLAPKLQFARGDFVELLISSNIARYSEFCSISRVLTWIDEHLEVVPCSRSDVFSNSKVTVIEKRMLMKLLTDCLDGEEKEFEGYENKTFLTYLKDRKLTDNLVHYVLYAISMSTDKTSFPKGVQNTKRFLKSLGRFGKTPFLYGLYGSGDLTQAFCRLSAVFGGIYALGQTLNGILMDRNNKFKGIVCGNQNISAPNLVCSVEKAPADFVKHLKCNKYISRGIFITDKSVSPSDTDFLTLLLYPPENSKNACVIIEVGHVAKTCPKGLFIVYMFTEQIDDPKTDLQHCVKNLLNTSDVETKPNILWSFYFSSPYLSNPNLNSNIENVFLCSGPDMDLDYDGSIKEARNIFASLYGDEEFLPRAPDPEEIIIGDEKIDNVESEDKAEEAFDDGEAKS